MNLAIIELNDFSLKLSIFATSNGRSKIIEEVEQPCKLGEEIFNDELLHPKTRNEILEVLKIFRNMTDSYKVEKIIAVASTILNKARNYRGFIEEIYNNTGISFQILSEDETNKLIYVSSTNTIDSSRGVIFYVGAFATNIIKYNRRTVLSSDIINYGTVNLLTDSNGKKRGYDEMVKIIKNKLKMQSISSMCEDDGVFLGCGSGFITVGRIAKKIARYPLELDNNYEISKDIMDKTSKFVAGLDLEKVGKIKGIEETDATRVLSATAIAKAIFDELSVKTLSVSTANVRDGLLATNLVLPPQERFNDLLANRLENYYEFVKDEHSVNPSVYSMALVLFKQLKVMHKLPRFYVKPLRIAAYMYDCGKCINSSNYSKYSLDVILNSNIYGVSHRELLIAAFICLCQNVDNLSLNDWVKYKDIVTEEDLDAVRKLGIIVKLAVALNASKKNNIQDVVCDILGDSIIMKTVVADGKNASFEIMEGMKVAPSYRKVYKKSLQII